MTGLIGWWPLHENSGSKAYDLSGNDNHGTLNGGITQGVAGKGGLTSYSFYGSDDKVDTSLNVPNSAFTFSAWIYPRNNLSEELAGIASTTTDGSAGWRLIIGEQSKSGTLDFEGFSGGKKTFSAFSDADVINEDEWVHITAVYDGSNAEIYVNAQQKAVDEGQLSSDQTLEFSSYYNSTESNLLKGLMSDIRVYNRALTPEEIQELYNWGSGDYARPPQESEGGVSRWKLDGDATDSWGNNDGATSGVNFTDNAIRGQSANFDGSEYVVIPDNSKMSEYTVSMWVQLDVLNDGNRHTALDYRGNNGIYFDNVGDGKFNYSHIADSTSWNTLSVPISDNWAHITGVWDGSTQYLYKNGSIVKRNSVSSMDSLDYSEQNIGRNRGNQYYLDGKIDDLRIYDKALSPEEIFELYRYGTRGRDMRKFTVNSRGR